MMNRLLVILCAIFAVLIESQLQKISPPSSSMINELKNKAISELKRPTSCEQSYYASKLLSLYKVPDISCNCEAIFHAASSNPYDTYYTIETAKTCRCNNFTPSQAAVENIKQAIKADDLSTYAGAALALSSMNQPVNHDNLLSYLRSLSQPSGLFKSNNAEDASESMENTSLALMLLSSYGIKDFADRVSKLLPSNGDDTSGDPMIFGDVMRISDKKPKLSSSALTLSAELLLAQLSSTNMKPVAIALDSLFALKEYKTAPFSLLLDHPVLSISSDHKQLHFHFIDILGNHIQAKSIDIKSLKKDTDNESLYSDAVDTNGVFDLSSFSLNIGRYVIDMAVTVEDRQSAINFKKHFIISDHLVISDVVAGITDSKSTPVGDLTSVYKEHGLKEVEGSALETDVFHVAFTLKTRSDASSFIKPHQTLVRFTHIESGTYTYFNAKPVRAVSSNKGYSYRAIISLADEIKTFLHLSGEYTVDIISGDVVYDGMMIYTLGAVTLTFPSKVVSDGSLYTKSLLHTSDNTLTPLPEIVHMMRPPAKRASMFMSMLFTIMAAAPLLVFVVYVMSQTPNLKKLANLSALLFIIAVSAILALYLGYWFAIPGFSFYDTIQYMVFMLPITYIIGRYALAAISEKKTKTAADATSSAGDVKKTN